MIAGIGVDIVDIRRMREAIDQHGERFAVRLLSGEEIGDYRASGNPAAFLAKRFAAKEALVKALGTGFRDGVLHRQISIVHSVHGQPRLACEGRINELLLGKGITASHLSLADEKNYAIAYVVLSTDN